MKDNAKRYQFLRDRFALESSNDEADFAKLAHLNGDEFDAALDAAMEKAGFEVAQEVEPVAWLYESGTIGGYDYLLTRTREVEGNYAESAMWIETPLFAAPQAVNAELLEACRKSVCALAFAAEQDTIFEDAYRDMSKAIVKAGAPA